MYIIITPECAPAARAGGLADVVFGLCRELTRLNHPIEIILPKYACLLHEHIENIHVIEANFSVVWNNDVVSCTAFHGVMNELNCIFIQDNSPHNFFQRDDYYGFPDDDMRFAFFSKAALEFLVKSNKQPNIIHTHDWHTALISALLREHYSHHQLNRAKICHTIHDFKYQGVVTDQVLAAVGLNPITKYHNENYMQDSFTSTALNLTKGAINYADFITTVSPRYAWEARFTDQGYGLGHTLFRHRDKFGGIVNGLDCEIWNPRTDTSLPYNYDLDSIESKYGNKWALRERLRLQDEFKPIVAYIGNLSTHNGVHLIRHAIFHALEHGTQFALLGSTIEAGIYEEFTQLKYDLKDNPNCYLELEYNEGLARLMYAGSDMLIIPSLIEPCGYSQMIALRYGTIPIVHGVGGLVDTVFDRDYSDKPIELRNGYVFHDPDYQGLESAMQRAIGLWYSFPSEFRQLIHNGMRQDVSWRQPTKNYINIYQHITVNT
jgi:starch synthase